MKKWRQKGSVVTYALMAIFLAGMLIAAMSQGAKKTVSTGHLDAMMLYMQADIKTIQEFVSECVQIYPYVLNVNDGTVPAINPNPPFPIYGNGPALDTVASPSSGNTGVEGGTDAGIALANIWCPGAPDGQHTIFTRKLGDRLKLLGDTVTYPTRYFSNTTEGAYIRVTRATGDPLWTEAISRLNKKYSVCAAAAVTASGTCVNGCFYFWIVRLPSSALFGEAAQPTCG